MIKQGARAGPGVAQPPFASQIHLCLCYNIVRELHAWHLVFRSSTAPDDKEGVKGSKPKFTVGVPRKVAVKHGVHTQFATDHERQHGQSVFCITLPEDVRHN